jgi:hypothetical protein
MHLTMSKLGRAAALSLALAAVGVPATAHPGELRGSPASMARQHEVAVAERYEFLADSAAVAALVREGRLEPLTGNADYALSRQISYPYARPEVRSLLERLAAEYRAATGEPLVVTSLVRTTHRQPRNAHKLSVHPAGMAVDLHPPASATARAWLERALLSLEDAGVLDATRERRPRHYHIAVFPEAYRRWAAAHPAPGAPPPAPIVALASGSRTAARRSYGADTMLMLVAAAGLALWSARRRPFADARAGGGNH